MLFMLMAAAAHQWWPGPTANPLPSIKAVREWASFHVQQALRPSDPPQASTTRAAEPSKPRADLTSRQTATAENAAGVDKRRAHLPLLQRCAEDELRIAAMRRMLGDAPQNGAPWLRRIEEGFQRRCSRLRPDADLLQEVQLRAASRIHLLEEDARLRIQAERETASAPPSRLIEPANVTD